MSEKNIVPFQFEGQAVRAVTIDGETWFVAKDVVEAVEARWHHTAIANIPDQWKGSDRITTPGGTQEMAILSEHGVYFYLGRSDKPKALPIQMWIAGEVLPQIRKTGSYLGTPQNKFDAIRALVDAAEEHERRLTKVEGALENMGAHDTHRTIKAHASFLGIRLNNLQAGDLGKRATALSKQRGYAIGTQPDDNFFTVNKYHLDILSEVFKLIAPPGK